MTTKIKKVIQIDLGFEHYKEFDQMFDKLSADIYDVSLGLYRYEVGAHFAVSGDWSNDKLMQGFDIATLISSYKCDEVWVFGATMSSVVMGGAKAFWLGDVPVKTAATIHRRFPFMRFNGVPLYTYAQRVENTMYKLYEGYPPAKNMWQKFLRSESCGSILRPPNGVLGGYADSRSFLSDADDWLVSYPNLRDRVRYMDSGDWGGTLEGYLKWWLMHIPHGVHKTDGIHDNWWHYIMNLDLIR